MTKLLLGEFHVKGASSAALRGWQACSLLIHLSSQWTNGFDTPVLIAPFAAQVESTVLQGGKAGCGAKSELKTVEVCNAVPAEPFADWQSPTFMRWHNAACMTVPRACLAAATLQSTLYAAGGQAGRVIWDTVEAYDPHHDTWSAVAARMHSGRKYTSAGVLEGDLISQELFTLMWVLSADAALHRFYKLCGTSSQHSL